MAGGGPVAETAEAQAGWAVGSPYALRISAIMSAPLVTASPHEDCGSVAQRMVDAGVSSVVVHSEPLGMVTDRDLRTRLVAAGRPPTTPVADIATRPVRTVEAGAPVGQALSEMVVAGVHHLPVVDGDDVVGMVTTGDMLRLQRDAPHTVAEAVHEAPGVDELATALEGLGSVVRTLLRAGADGQAVARVVAATTDAAIRRLIVLATAELGDPPAKFGFLAFGSLGRREQTLHTDQDTGLLLPDGLDERQAEWFAALGRWVTDALARCGFARCHGGVMASEPSWRQSIGSWHAQFRQWLRVPGDVQLLGAEIAFDVRTVAGDLDAADHLTPVAAEAGDHPLFLARLARMAVSHRPPLRAFGRLAVERRGGTAPGTFDVKAKLLLPITDLARLHTLAHGGRELTTVSRLQAAADHGQLSSDLAATLASGHELALRWRLERHARLRSQGRALDNRLEPAALPAPVRAQLVETAKAIKTAQEAVDRDYALSMVSG